MVSNYVAALLILVAVDDREGRLNLELLCESTQERLWKWECPNTRLSLRSALLWLA